jgi:hypothetical protein
MPDDRAAAILCPIKLLEKTPLCDYPGVKKVFAKHKLSEAQGERLRLSLHVFLHKILAAGFEFYEKAPPPVGEDALRAILVAWASELEKEKNKASESK